MMYKFGDVVYPVSVDIHSEDDWNVFISTNNWFVDDAPLDEIKRSVLSHPGWVHFLDVDGYKIDEFLVSPQWEKLRDSGLAVCIKRCPVMVKGYRSSNEAYTRV